MRAGRLIKWLSTGMLASEATIIAVSKALKDHNVAKLVVDPVRSPPRLIIITSLR